MSRRKDYSIPDCPKIGRYDGLGMTAVPLAIADKERELGISHSSSSSGRSIAGVWHPSNEKKIYTQKLNSLEEELHKRFQAGYDAGYAKGYKTAKEETLHELSKYSNEEIRDMINNDEYHQWIEYNSK